MLVCLVAILSTGRSLSVYLLQIDVVRQVDLSVFLSSDSLTTVFALQTFGLTGFGTGCLYSFQNLGVSVLTCQLSAALVANAFVVYAQFVVNERTVLTSNLVSSVFIVRINKVVLACCDSDLITVCTVYCYGAVGLLASRNVSLSCDSNLATVCTVYCYGAVGLLACRNVSLSSVCCVLTGGADHCYGTVGLLCCALMFAVCNECHVGELDCASGAINQLCRSLSGQNLTISAVNVVAIIRFHADQFHGPLVNRVIQHTVVCGYSFRFVTIGLIKCF